MSSNIQSIEQKVNELVTELPGMWDSLTILSQLRDYLPQEVSTFEGLKQLKEIVLNMKQKGFFTQGRDNKYYPNQNNSYLLTQ